MVLSLMDDINWRFIINYAAYKAMEYDQVIIIVIYLIGTHQDIQCLQKKI